MHVLLQDTKMADAAPAAKPADEAMDGDVRSNGPSEVTHALCLLAAALPGFHCSIPNMSTMLHRQQPTTCWSVVLPLSATFWAVLCVVRDKSASEPELVP